MKNFKWITNPAKYGSGELLVMGNVTIGRADYSMRSKSEPITYRCVCFLPGIKQAEEKYPTIDAAKARLERMVTTWFSWVSE